MVRNAQTPISERWDSWLGSLVDALDSTGSSEERCAPLSCEMARQAVFAHLSRRVGTVQCDGLSNPFDLTDALTVYSPAICNRGRLRRSTPRSLDSSCMM